MTKSDKCLNYRFLEEKRERQKLFEEMVIECFPNLGKSRNIYPGSSENSKKMNPKRLTPRHIIIEMSTIKDEEEILKASREKFVTCAMEP